MLSKALSRLLILCLILTFVLAVAAAQDEIIPEGDKILAWIGDGQSAGAVSTNNPGELVFIDGGEALTTVMALPQGTTRVMACGDEPMPPDRSQFAFFVGNETGTLYTINGTEPPEIAAEGLFAMACTGSGTFRYKPDASQFGYMAYPADVVVNIYPKGQLVIVNTDDLSVEANFEQVIAFDVINEYFAFVSLFTNNQGKAVEAAITAYNNETDREVATLYADNGCEFISGGISIITPQAIVVVMGQRCAGQIRSQFYTIDTVTRSATLALSVPTVGGYAVASRTNQVVPTPEGGTVFFTIPDGVTNHTVGISSVVLNTMSYDTIYERNAVMARYTNVPTYSENSYPAFSPDRAWWAMALNTPNNEPSLAIFDLAYPDLPPIEIIGSERGDVITDILFTPDNTQLIYVAGGNAPSNNSLFGVNLETGNDFRIRRGRYGEGVISPDGDKVALINWKVESERQPAYQTFVVLDIGSSAETVTFVGASVADGIVSNLRFVYPLAWLRGE